jgi:hypothetical protein
MFSMSCFALVTATIAVTSSRREQILAARILNCKISYFLINHTYIFEAGGINAIQIFILAWN